MRLLTIKHTADSGAKVLDIVFVATIAIVLLLSFINLARSKPPPCNGVHLKFYALAGLFGFGAPFLAEIAVASHLPALLFVIIVATTPVWTLLISAITRVEHLDATRAFGTLVGFIAVMTVIFAAQADGRVDDASAQPLWIIAAFVIPLLYALYLLYIANRWPENLDNLQGAQGQATAALVIFFGFWLRSKGQFNDITSLALQWSIWAVVASEIMGLVLLFQIARMRGGSFVSQANYIAVVAGAVLSTVFFGQPFKWAIVVGIILLVTSLWLSTRRTERTA
jgi:drug/metabolite transporter (DMT)-like permease